MPVFLDGGVRRGTDVFKALALGASGIFVSIRLPQGKALHITFGHIKDKKYFCPLQYALSLTHLKESSFAIVGT